MLGSLATMGPRRCVVLHRRICAVTVAVCLAGALAVTVPGGAGAADGGGSDVMIARYGGADRYATSLRVAEAVAAEAGGSALDGRVGVARLGRLESGAAVGWGVDLAIVGVNVSVTRLAE